MKNKKVLLKKIFADVVENPEFDLGTIKKYFHQDYIQYVDGKTLNFDQFVQHMKTLKTSLKNIKITFDHLAEEDNIVCSIHYPEGTKTNGKYVKAKVIALFKFQDSQLIMSDELTQLIIGEDDDRDLGSRH